MQHVAESRLPTMMQDTKGKRSGVFIFHCYFCRYLPKKRGDENQIVRLNVHRFSSTFSMWWKMNCGSLVLFFQVVSFIRQKQNLVYSRFSFFFPWLQSIVLIVQDLLIEKREDEEIQGLRGLRGSHFFQVPLQLVIGCSY